MNLLRVITRNGKDKSVRNRHLIPEINVPAIKNLSPEGLLSYFSCLAYISGDLFQKVVSCVAAAAERNVRILQKTGQPHEYPVNIYFSEERYLKGLFYEVIWP